MICPRWVFTRIQPIAVDDVLAYLQAALETPESWDEILEIGGEDVMTYGQMMLVYAEVRGLKRSLIPAPVLTPRLSSYWVHWMTPIPASIARPLIDGLRNEVVVRDSHAREIFPAIEPIRYREAVERALNHLDAGDVETGWSDALAASQGDVRPVRLETREGMIIERRQRLVNAPQENLFDAFQGLGGKAGWLYADWAWRLRGELDRIVGGVGLRRGRRDSQELRPGDAVDFWRVEIVDPPRLVRLRAEMKLPGRAWLQFEALPAEDGRSILNQDAYFAPKGLSGMLYWYGLYPIHSLIFSGLISALSDRAEASAVRPKESAA